MAYGETYEEFTEKFKPKLTTDDCYTPTMVYEAIANWVAGKYKLPREKFYRPFYPGGDFENEDYTDKIVVDNPPFSILSKITDFYTERNIKFFLFAPTLTLFDLCKNDDLTVIPNDSRITYENGAKVNTSFVTNLEPDTVRVAGYASLYKIIDEADCANRKEKAKPELPKYKYPDNVLTAAMAKTWRYVDYNIPKSESKFIRRLDSQKPLKKAIFGSGLLLSKAQAAKAQAAKAQAAKAVIMWELSDKEQAIVNAMSKKLD